MGRLGVLRLAVLAAGPVMNRTVAAEILRSCECSRAQLEQLLVFLMELAPMLHHELRGSLGGPGSQHNLSRAVQRAEEITRHRVDDVPP